MIMKYVKKIFSFILVGGLLTLAYFYLRSNVGGNSYFVKLEASPSTGYEWQYSILNDSIVKVIKKDNMKESDDKITEVYEIKGLKEGSTLVTFRYVNDSEDKVGIKENVEVIVDSNLNVSKKY